MAENDTPENNQDDRMDLVESSVVVDNSEDFDWMSDASSPTDSDSEDYPLDERLREPSKYFRELDTLEAKVFSNSMFEFYMDGTLHEPFTGSTHLKVGHGGKTKVEKLNVDAIKSFYQEVLNVANENLSLSGRDASSAPRVLNLAVENMFHFIECRHIILWVMENIEAMEAASYCGDVVSILVIDKAGHNVARLLPIQCNKIKHLAIAFENCLIQLIGVDRSAVLVDTEMAFANEVSEACRNILSEVGLYVPSMPCAELWRCAVHVLDMAVLSYAGAHTQFFGITGAKCITLPGPFLETQYFMFRRRSFLCLGEFLAGQEAWVLESYHPDAPQLNLASLYLSTDAMTLSDIWGPMWKSCVIRNGRADHNHIHGYNIGNGVILPWEPPSPDSPDSIKVGKDEIFCHWISDKTTNESGSLIRSSGEGLHPDDILLIGASTKLEYNPRCNTSTSDTRQLLRNSGAISELGTMKSMRIVDSDTVQIQVGGSYMKVGGQRTYKRRGRTWKDAVIENWKNEPEGRNVRILEFKFGVEVSACTGHARRRRLIQLLGSNTMMNYLRSGTLKWSSTECEHQFYAALESSDYRVFRKLYLSQKDWQKDIGNAITHCLNGLKETGVNEKDLDLLWVPDMEPGQRVNIKLSDHNWVGLLKDNEDCCTMAVLEDKCLVLPSLTQARKCQNGQAEPGLAFGSRSDESFEASIFETAFMLHQHAVPRKLRLVRCHGPKGLSSRFDYLWSTSLLEGGERFSFGGNGQLKFVKSLGNSQILAHWKSPWESLEVLKGRFQSKGHEKRHREYIRDEKGGVGPIHVLVMSSEPNSMSSLFAALRESPGATSAASNPLHIHRYDWIPSKATLPKGSVEVAPGETTRRIMSLWKTDQLSPLDNEAWAEFRRSIAPLIAAIPSQVDDHHGDLDRQAGWKRDGVEDV